jgi:hypothetical protein
MQCPNCGKSNRSADNTCSRCGIQLSVLISDSKQSEVPVFKELAAYIKPIILNTEDLDKLQNLEQEAIEAEINTIPIPDINFWQRNWFVLDIILLTFPLWCRGNAAITRNEGLVEVFYIPPWNHRLNTDVFIRRVIRYAAKATDHLARHHGIKRIDIWASGRISSEANGSKSEWKGLHFTINAEILGNIGSCSIFDMASRTPERYLILNSARWVETQQFPPWPGFPVDYPGI